MSDLYLDLKPSIHSNNARDFLELLSPTGTVFGDEEPNAPWLFRGIADASYKLVPSAFRPDWPLKNFTSKSRTPYSSHVEAEVDALHKFFKLVDTHLLELPEDSQELRSLMRGLVASYGASNKERNWLWEGYAKLYSTIALAQHYGVPTRFLDWSRDPLTAAYFAANPLLETAENHKMEMDLIDKYCQEIGLPVDVTALAKIVRAFPTNLSVWAFKFPKLDVTSWVEDVDAPFVVVTAPTVTNRNLAAQEGVFTLISPKFTTVLDGYMRSAGLTTAQ